MVPARGAEHAQQPVLQRQADALVVGRVLGFGVDADAPALLARLALGQLDHLGQRGNLELAVEGLVAVAQGLHGAQLLDLRQGEVAGEETVRGHAVEHHGAAARRELRQVLDVGGVDQVGLVPRDELAVLGGHQVRLDVVGAQLDAQRIGLQRVVGQVAAGAAAVADHQRRILGAAPAALFLVMRRRRQRGCQHQAHAQHRQAQLLLGRCRHSTHASSPLLVGRAAEGRGRP